MKHNFLTIWKVRLDHLINLTISGILVTLQSLCLSDSGTKLVKTDLPSSSRFVHCLTTGLSMWEDLTPLRDWTMFQVFNLREDDFGTGDEVWEFSRYTCIFTLSISDLVLFVRTFTFGSLKANVRLLQYLFFMFFRHAGSVKWFTIFRWK